MTYAHFSCNLQHSRRPREPQQRRRSCYTVNGVFLMGWREGLAAVWQPFSRWEYLTAALARLFRRLPTQLACSLLAFLFCLTRSSGGYWASAALTRLKNCWEEVGARHPPDVVQTACFLFPGLFSIVFYVVDAVEIVLVLCTPITSFFSNHDGCQQ